MSDRDAFLKSIQDNTADEAPRLIYADWLADHGLYDEERGVRAEVELLRYIKTKFGELKDFVVAHSRVALINGNNVTNELTLIGTLEDNRNEG